MKNRILAIGGIILLFAVYVKILPENFPLWAYYIFIPIYEELKYRYVPLMLTKAIAPNLVQPVLVLTSIVFGLAHGNDLYHLSLQGLFGYIAGRIMLAWGYWYAVILHISWNVLLYFHILN